MHKSLQIMILAMLGLICLALVAFIPIALSLFYIIQIFIIYQFNKKPSRDKIPKFYSYYKLIFVLVSLAIIYFNYATFLGVDAGVPVLATFLFAKALETKKQRDLIILFNFALFVSASLFLFSQSFIMAVAVLLCLTLGLVGLYRVQMALFSVTDVYTENLKTDLLNVLKVMALAVPFFILLFLFFPRFPPLWHVPIPKNNAVTGLSDQMSPGSIAELSQSTALAFRIIGNIQQLPHRENLYWRAMVLDQYDGQTWTRNTLNTLPQKNLNIHLNKHLNYQYLNADQNQTWITALEQSIPNESRYYLHQDGAITARRAVQVNSPINLQWVGNNQEIFDDHHQENRERINLKYPQKFDTKAQQLATQLFVQSQSSPEKYVNNVLNWYRINGFSYTLSPGRLGENRVDDFLFGSRQGFCEHYASSFTLLMRYVGIPARVVIGYQGGQFAPDQKSWEVRQLDAHAWSEVYLNGKWQRIDPTAIISPQRIDQGMQDLINQDRNILGDSNFSYQHYSVLKSLRVWSDYASYQWQSKVVGYDTDKQKNWMKKLGLDSSYSYGMILIAGILFIVLTYFLIKTANSYMKQSKFERVIAKFSKHLNSEDRQKEHESFQQWMLRLAEYTDQPQCFKQSYLMYQKIVYLKQENSELVVKFENLLKECSTDLRNVKKTCHHQK